MKNRLFFAVISVLALMIAIVVIIQLNNGNEMTPFFGYSQQTRGMILENGNPIPSQVVVYCVQNGKPVQGHTSFGSPAFIFLFPGPRGDRL